jgi:hypothetical protein
MVQVLGDGCGQRVQQPGKERVIHHDRVAERQAAIGVAILNAATHTLPVFVDYPAGLGVVIVLGRVTPACSRYCRDSAETSRAQSPKRCRVI